MIKAALARLARGSIVYGIGGMLQRFIGLLLLPFFTRVLTPEDYGVVALISLLGVAMSGLLTLGTGNSMGLIYYREMNEAKRPSIIWSNILLMSGNGLFWYIIIFLLAPVFSGWMFQTDRYADLIRLALLGSIFTIIFEPLLAYLRMEEKAKSYVLLTLSNSILNVALSVWFVLVLQIGIHGLMLAGVLANGIMLAVNWWVVGRKLAFGIDKKLFRPLIRIGFPSIFGLFAFLIIDYADRQMIERMVGLSELGIYSVGYSFGLVMSIIMGAFSAAWSPFFMSYIHKRDEARQVFASVLTYYVIGFGSLVVLFFLLASPIVALMTAPTFHQAYQVVGLVAAAYALKGCYLIVLPGIYFAKKLHKQSIIEWIAAIANIGLNLWLIPLHGIMGAAIATFVSYLMLPILAWIVSHKYLAVDYQWKRLVVMLIVTTAAATCLYQISSQLGNELMQMIILNSVVLITFLIVIYTVILTMSEREQIRSKLKV